MNSWQIQQLKFAFGIGAFMSFYGIVGLITIILDRQFGWGNQQRIIVIALILLTLPFTLIIGYVASRRSKKKEEEAKKEAAEPKAAETAPAAGETPQKLTTPSGTYDDLPKGAEEVVQFIRSSNLNENGKEAVYSLPWYLVAGTPRSGKSSLVLGSNLNFQTLPSQRESERKLIRPTQSVDWRVTSDAVFVDTAGRYQTEGIDQDEWSAVLETIKKNRSNRPIDGFLLVANAEKILGSDEREIEEIAKVMRTRLDEAMQRFKVRFPVYVIFTHADSIEGFRDSFSASKKEGQNLVWGATIPIEKSENAHALFDSEFELLQNSIMKRRLMRLSAPFPPVRQLRIFNFPLHFGSARRKIGAFISALFRPNPFSENPFLRGFYFTAAPAGRGGVQGERTMSSSPQTIGETFFTEKLFRDVVLRDKDLVRTFQQQRQRPPIFGWLMTFLGAFLTFLLLALAALSLYNNKVLLDEAQAKGQVVLSNVKADVNINPLDKDVKRTREEIDAITNLRGLLEKLDNYERNGAPIYMRLGLYSGDDIYRQKLLNIYFNAVERRFKTPAVRKLEADLQKFADGQAIGNPNKLTPQEEETLSNNYDKLKAYLMLSEKYKDKANGSDLSLVLKEYWKSESKIPSDLEAAAQQDLEFYAKQVDRPEFPRVRTDDNLVSKVRTKLKAFPPVFRYYKRKITEITKEVEEKVGVTNVDGILARNGGDTGFVDGNYTVPGAFTIEGYKRMRTAITNADKEISAEDWVMGEQGKGELTPATDAGRLEEKYFGNYSDHWRNFVRGVTVKPYTKDGAKDSLESFASSRSPIRIILTEVERNTNFSKPIKLGWWDTFTQFINSFFEQKVNLDTGGNSQVEKEFRPLFVFVEDKADKNAKIPIEEYQNEIGLVSQKFRTFSINEINEIATMQDDERNRKFSQLRTSQGKIDTMLKSFKETPSAQAVADLLRLPLGNLDALLGSGAKEQITRRWTNEIVAAAKEVEQGFPFEDGASETDLTKLKEYLNPVDGRFSKFFDDNLKKDFAETNGELKPIETSRFKYSDEFVAYVNAAFKLRTALFGKNNAPNFEYAFTIKPVTGALIEATIDGQTVKSAEGSGSATLKFPAQTGQESGVWMRFSSTDTASSTSTSTSANTSGPPVNSSGSTNAATQPGKSGSDTSSKEIKKQGTWGLFRFFYEGDPKIQPTTEYLLTYNIGGKAVTVIIKPSGGDLFNRSIFKAARAPQTIFK